MSQPPEERWTSRKLEELPLYSIVHSGFSVWQKFGRGEWYEPRSTNVVRPHQIILFCEDEWGNVDLTVVFSGYKIKEQNTNDEGQDSVNETTTT